MKIKNLFMCMLIISFLGMILYSSYRYFFLSENLVRQELILDGYRNINILGSKLFYMDLCEKQAIRKKFIAQKDNKNIEGYVCINFWLKNKIIVD